jgi:hypothetical protein
MIKSKCPVASGVAFEQLSGKAPPLRETMIHSLKFLSSFNKKQILVKFTQNTTNCDPNLMILLGVSLSLQFFSVLFITKSIFLQKLSLQFVCLYVWLRFRWEKCSIPIMHC